MTHDRTYYSAMSTQGLLLTAREQGINPELAIAITNRLADTNPAYEGYRGTFRFNHEDNKTHA
jgi:hypothetical protein